MSAKETFEGGCYILGMSNFYKSLNLTMWLYCNRRQCNTERRILRETKQSIKTEGNIITKCIKHLYNVNYYIAMNAGQSLQRCKWALKQQRCDSVRKCFKYHRWTMWSMERPFEKVGQQRNL